MVHEHHTPPPPLDNCPLTRRSTPSSSASLGDHPVRRGGGRTGKPLNGGSPEEVEEGSVLLLASGWLSRGVRDEKGTTPAEHLCRHQAKLGQTTRVQFMPISSWDIKAIRKNMFWLLQVTRLEGCCAVMQKMSILAVNCSTEEISVDVICCIPIPTTWRTMDNASGNACEATNGSSVIFAL